MPDGKIEAIASTGIEMKPAAIFIVGMSALIAIILMATVFVSLFAAVGLAIGIAIVLLVVFRPFTGVIVYLLLIYFMPQLLFPSLEKYRIVLMTAILILLVFFIRRLLNKEQVLFISGKHGLLMLLLLILVPVSLMVNGYLVEAWDAFYNFLTVLLLFFIIVNVVEDFGQFRIICWTTVFCTVALAINGLVMAFRGYDLVGNMLTPDGRIGWISESHFGDPNDFALLINASLPFTLINLLEKKIRWINRILMFIISSILIAAIYYTNSRGGFIALVAILILLAYKKWGLLKGSGVGVLFYLLAILIAPSRMADISPYETSASGRVFAWMAGLTMLKSNPIFGIGFNNFSAYYGLAAHSAFIQCMAELGLAGYYVWIALLFSNISGLKSVENNANEIKAKYSGTIQLALMGIIVSSLFLSQAFSPVLYILLGLSTLSIKYADSSNVRAPRFTIREALWIFSLMGSSIALYKLLAVLYV